MKLVQAKHGVICRLPNDPFGYFGWASVARMANGTLVVASSGLRAAHICPWGKTVLHFSDDDGQTWSESLVINDSPIDNRDAGVLSLGGKRLLVSWFTSDTRRYWENEEAMLGSMGTGLYQRYLTLTRSWQDATVFANLGSWLMFSEDGQNWSEPIKAPVTSPHGPVRQMNGDLLYLGKAVTAGFAFHDTLMGAGIHCHVSKDEGRSWSFLGQIPLAEGTEEANYHEPHIVELPSGKLVGLIRYQHSAAVQKHDKFTIFQSESMDGGKSWTRAYPTGVQGSPPHLLLHSSGAVICVYGRRQAPYGEMAMISYDECQTWQRDLVLRADGPDSDLGYPASVELADGSVFTIYYQKYAAGEKPSLLWTRWELA